MAESSTQLGDIEERFFTCSLCLETLQEPKALPCLHRYCKECMHMVLTRKKGTFNCPLCNEECVIPPEGAEGFRTDFFVNSILEFLQLQTTYKKDNVKPCYGCKETKVVTSFCFTCRNFLCQECYQFHLENDMVKEHRPHLLDLQTVDVRSLTLEKLTSLTEDPRCTVHVKHVAQMCCETCGNIPICVACIFGEHKGHVTHEVKILAKTGRENVKAIMTELEKCRGKLYEIPERVAKVRITLTANVEQQLEEARTAHTNATSKIMQKAEADRNEMMKRRGDILKRKEEECNRVLEELEEETRKLKEKYSKIVKKKEQQYDTEVDEVDKETLIMDGRCSNEVDEMNGKLQRFEERINKGRLNNEKKITGVYDHSTRTISRYEDLTTTAEIVQASRNEWTEALCLPDITAAGKALIGEAKKEFTELESWSVSGVGGSLLDSVTPSVTQESVVNIKGIADGWRVWGVSTSSDDSIVVTGRTQSSKSHVTVIDRLGRVIQQDQFEKALGSKWNPCRHCCSISEHLIVSVCESNTIELYDIRGRGECLSRNIGGMGYSWPGFATCVAADAQRNIYVGGSKGHVLVLDDQLNPCRTMNLPASIFWARDLVVHGGQLVVCDWRGKGSYAVTMDKEEARIVHRFTSPDGGREWSPRSVCTDSNNYVYMLWHAAGECVLAKYSQDCRQLLTTRQVDVDSRSIATMITGVGEEKLLIVTCENSKLYTFGLQVD